MADSVGWSRVPAVDPSFAAIAVRNRFMIVRTRVRFARLISARTWDCFARFSTDFLRFFTFVAAPCAIQLTSCYSDRLTNTIERASFCQRTGQTGSDISLVLERERTAARPKKGRPLQLLLIKRVL